MKYSTPQTSIYDIPLDTAFFVLADLMENTAIFLVDKAMRIQYWNIGAEKLLGFHRDAVIGHSCSDINYQSCKQGCHFDKQTYIDNLALTFTRPDGVSIALRKFGRVFLDSENNFLGSLEVLIPDQIIKGNTIAIKPTKRFDGVVSFHGLLSRDHVMHLQFELISRVAETETTVLIRGESGTGKELVARAIHQLSHRRQGPFLAINCAALSPMLLESELFGHTRGAFTGAVRDHVGIFQQANGGSIFLDEVAELPMDLQAKLLRVLQERSFTPVGSTHSIHVDVRILSATHRSLREEVKAGHFREDLMYRLRVVPIFLPPLRERREDIMLLLWTLIENHNQQSTRHIESISPEAMQALLDHPWPGNVRELQNVVEYAFVVGRGTELLLEELPPEFREKAPATSQAQLLPTRTIQRNEREAILQALAETNGRLEETAKLLNISTTTLWRKRKKWGI